MSANITWFIKNNINNNYTASYDYYFGNIKAENGDNIEIQAWYNYQGTSNVPDIENTKLNIVVPNIDEAYLFKYLTVAIDDKVVSPTINSETNYSYDIIGKFSGSANNGTVDEQNDKVDKNMHKIVLTIRGIDYKVKENVKNLILDIITL